MGVNINLILLRLQFQCKMWFLVGVVVLCAYGVSGQATVTLQRQSPYSTVCGGSETSIRCQTTVNEVLEWRNAAGDIVRFTTANDTGATGSLGPVFLNLTEVDGTTLVSIATVASPTSDVLLFCFNGADTENVAVNVADPPSAPLNLACQPIGYNSVRCTWQAPTDIPNCCPQYVVGVANNLGTTFIGSQQEVFDLNIASDTTVGVFCRDGTGRNGTGSNQVTLRSPSVELNVTGVDCSSSNGSVRVTPMTGSNIGSPMTVTCMFGAIAGVRDGSSNVYTYTNGSIRGEGVTATVVFNQGITRTVSSDICKQFIPTTETPIPIEVFVDRIPIWVWIVIAILAVLFAAAIIVAIVMTIFYIQLKGGKDSASGDNSMPLKEKL